jgi:hypothetical protein
LIDGTTGNNTITLAVNIKEPEVFSISPEFLGERIAKDTPLQSFLRLIRIVLTFIIRN